MGTQIKWSNIVDTNHIHDIFDFILHVIIFIGIFFAGHIDSSHLTREAILKQLLVLPMIILVSIHTAYAEDKSWYEIDGIKIRNGWTGGRTVFETAWTNDKKSVIESRSQGSKVSQERTPLLPVAISLPETLMNSWSFRGAIFEFKPKREIKDLYPYQEEVNDDTTFFRQRDSIRTLLYDEFFNASDKAFADANPNWALSADATSSRIFLGYFWGVFIPAFEYHRFLKFGWGLGVYYADVSYKLNLCSEYKVSINPEEASTEKVYGGECLGKNEIDSASAKFFGSSHNINISLWERVTKNTIWKIFSGTEAFSLGDNSKHCNLKNHNNKLNIWMTSSTVELISFTYRF